MTDSECRLLAIHHVTLLVEDLQRALDFYTGLLGLPVNPHRPDMDFPGAWLDLPAGQQIHLMQLPSPDPRHGRPAHAGRDRHCALAVSHLETLIQRLDKAGTPYTRSRSGRPAIFCRDPDGNALELMAPP